MNRSNQFYSDMNDLIDDIEWNLGYYECKSGVAHSYGSKEYNDGHNYRYQEEQIASAK